MAIVEGPSSKRMFLRADGSLLRWTDDGRLVAHGTERRLPKLVDMAYCARLDRAVTLKANGKIQVLQGPSFYPLRTFEVRASGSEYAEPFNVAISADGTRVAFEDEDKNVIVWNVASGRSLLSQHIESSRVIHVEFDPDGSLWTTFEPKNCRGTKVQRVGPVREQSRSRMHAEVGPDGRFATPHWSLDLGGSAWDAIPSPDGRRIALSMSGDTGPWTGGRTAIVDASSGGDLVWLRHPDMILSTVVWWKHLLIVGGSLGYLGVFEPLTGRRRWSLSGHTADVEQAVIDDDRLFTLDDVGQVRTIDLSTLSGVP